MSFCHDITMSVWDSIFVATDNVAFLMFQQSWKRYYISLICLGAGTEQQSVPAAVIESFFLRDEPASSASHERLPSTSALLSVASRSQYSPCHMSLYHSN